MKYRLSVDLLIFLLPFCYFVKTVFPIVVSGFKCFMLTDNCIFFPLIWHHTVVHFVTFHFQYCIFSLGVNSLFVCHLETQLPELLRPTAERPKRLHTKCRVFANDWSRGRPTEHTFQWRSGADNCVACSPDAAPQFTGDKCVSNLPRGGFGKLLPVHLLVLFLLGSNIDYLPLVSTLIHAERICFL